MLDKCKSVQDSSLTIRSRKRTVYVSGTADYIPEYLDFYV
jgi:hypothetical protein